MEIFFHFSQWFWERGNTLLYVIYFQTISDKIYSSESIFRQSVTKYIRQNQFTCKLFLVMTFGTKCCVVFNFETRCPLPQQSMLFFMRYRCFIIH